MASLAQEERNGKAARHAQENRCDDARKGVPREKQSYIRRSALGPTFMIAFSDARSETRWQVYFAAGRRAGLPFSEHGVELFNPAAKKTAFGLWGPSGIVRGQWNGLKRN